LTNKEIDSLEINPDFAMIIKVTSKKQDTFEPFVEYLKLAFDVEPSSQKLFNCDTGIYFQYIALKKKVV
jgi:hypothetical protein